MIRLAESNVFFETAQSLGELLKYYLCPEPIENSDGIGVCYPHEPEDFKLTIWVYNFEETAEGSGRGFVSDPLNPNMEIMSPTQLKLNVLISAHSKAPAKTKLSDEYKILGKAFQVIKDNPIIDEKFLMGSLKSAERLPLINTIKTNQEGLNKIWNNANKPIKPSFVVQITSVELDSTRTRPISPRVTDTTIVTVHKEGVNR